MNKPDRVKSVRRLIEEAEAEIRVVGPAEAQALLGEPGTALIDLRDVRELDREGRLPGAFHCPRGMLEFWLDPESPYHKPIFSEANRFVFFCAMGWRSALATKTAQDMGLADVCHMAGGFNAWREAGLPVEMRPRSDG